MVYWMADRRVLKTVAKSVVEMVDCLDCLEKTLVDLRVAMLVAVRVVQ
jgi:hypothetical protein